MISFWKEKSSSRLDELLNSVAILRTISANSYVEGRWMLGWWEGTGLCQKNPSFPTKLR